jgi:hypothetical protein
VEPSHEDAVPLEERVKGKVSDNPMNRAHAAPATPPINEKAPARVPELAGTKVVASEAPKLPHIAY